MSHHQFKGDKMKKILKYVLPEVNGRFIPVPQCWKQNISFYDNTIRIYQQKAGPCGLLAVIQAHIIAAQKFNRFYSPQELLRNAVLELMLKIRPTFALCYNYDLQDCVIDVFITNDKNEAYEFLKQYDYFNNSEIVFLLAISYAIVAGPMTLGSYAFPETFISIEHNTDIHFVLLLLTGKAIDILSDRYRIVGNVIHSGITGCDHDIGFISAIEEEQCKNLLFPSFQTWVIYYGGHFTAISRSDKGEFVEFDTFNHSSANECIILTKDHILTSKLKEIAHEMDK